MPHCFTFKFPNDMRALPRCRYELLPSGIGMIETDDESLATALTCLYRKRVGAIRQVRPEDIKRLRGETKSFDEISATPSFTKQTKWRSGFFDLHESPGTCYLNPGLEWWDGALHLFARRNLYSFDMLGRKREDNDLAIFRLMPDLSVKDCIVPTPPRRYPREQWEDPRVFVYDGRCFVSFATMVRGMGWKIRQSLVVLDDDFSRFSVAVEPQFGGSHPVPQLAQQTEKNWTWFVRGPKLYCVYSLHPMEVFTMDSGAPVKLPVESPEALPWEHGTLRGGTNPELRDGQYWVFFHSSMPWKDCFGHCVMGTRRRYYMGALTFTADPPFRITAITPKPLLTGSEDDPRTLNGPPVVFPCGAKLIDGEWLISMGINDEQCGWISIPGKELTDLMVRI